MVGNNKSLRWARLNPFQELADYSCLWYKMMDAPFALQGYLAGNGSKHQFTNKSKGSPSIDLAYQPMNALHKAREFHSSRVVSESSKAGFANRPLSPHLALKKPQLSATYSISHRILGGVLAGGIMLVPVAMKFSLLYDV